MFTGIIEELGTVERVTRGRVSAVIAIRAEHILSDLKIGDSVAVNGVCLTATGLTGHGFTADVMHETLDRSALAGLGPGSPVNLERAMAANGRFGGHIVSGHIDGTGTITALRKEKRLTGVEVEDLRTGARRELFCDGLFVAIGRVPDTALFAGQVELDPSGYIVAGETTRTSVPGVFAVGDARTKAVRQIVTAVADEEFLLEDAVKDKTLS